MEEKLNWVDRKVSGRKEKLTAIRTATNELTQY